MLRFEPVGLDKKEEYQERYRTWHEKLSDYSYVNMWCWRDVYGLEWAWTDNATWIRQTKPETVYWAPVGNAEPEELVKTIQQLPGNISFTRLPEAMAYELKSQPLNITFRSARDHWDYIYSVQDLIELPGKTFAKKKELLDTFTAENSFNYVELDNQSIEEALTLQAEWCLWKDCEGASTLEDENKAIVNAFVNWPFLPELFGAGLTINGEMVAYTVAEPLSNDTVLIHFEKACPHYPGAYQAINQMFLERSASQFTWVNREQDLGEEGLRKAKMSYNPAHFLKKYEAAYHGEKGQD